MPRRTPRQTVLLVAMICVPLTLGVWVRTTVPNFLAADLSFETTILLGILVGPLAAMAGGAVLAVPAVLHHEYLGAAGESAGRGDCRELLDGLPIRRMCGRSRR